jgi:hypothetical protein
MKIFWSWQFDTPGKTGRHFVWDVLADAIAVLKEPSDVEEPSECEAREALHLEDDRKGVEGSPDLAPKIFKKIDQAAVFVADVTLVGERSISADSPTEAPPKKLINSNVAIEYGYALRALTDARVLMIQNVHYGGREELPFDLKHKAGPIQFRIRIAIERQADDGSEFQHPAFREALLTVAGAKDAINSRLLGNWLAKYAGKVVDGVRFEQCGQRNEVALWQLSRLA